MDAQSTAALTVLCHTLAPLIAIPVFLIIFGIPAWMVVRLAKIRAGERMNAADAAAMGHMAARLAVMDQRMAVLETILDAQVPEWRGNAGNTGGDYARQAG